MSADSTTLERRWIRISFILLLFIAGALLLWAMRGLLLLIFAGMLIAILLDASARWIAKFSPIPRPVGVIATAMLAILLLVTGSLLVGPDLADQGAELAEDISGFVASVEREIMAVDAIEEQVEKTSIDITKLLPSPGGFLGGATAILGTTLGAIANIVLVFVFAIYLALDPKLYIDGALRLVPASHRARAGTVIDEMGGTLRYWLAGKAAMMLLLGIVCYIVLALLGVPLAMLLAVIVGVTSFVPIIGPAIAGALMILVALTVSWQLALWVIGFYLLLQAAESYLLMPLIQSRAINLPAGLIIAAQVMFGILFGALGVALATPITALVAVMVKRLYIEDVLDEPAKAA